MIRMIQSTSASHAKSYFSSELGKTDYYINDQELQGKFHGKLAEQLKLNGAVTKEAFFALCENINPTTGEQLTKRTNDDRTVGYDINFHSPKSLSILHALSKDNHILDAFSKSVTETMQDIETDMETRVRKDGQYDNRKTGNLIYADFVHQTARPVSDNLPDPHLHSHCFVFNVTQDKTENKLKAGQFRNIKRDMPYYQERFQKRLSDKIMALGYRVRKTEKSFEIEGVPPKVIELFSKRSDEIGRIAKEKGITDAKSLDQLGARTRSKKLKNLNMGELKAEWKQQIHNLGISKESIENQQAVRFAPKKIQRGNSKDCVNHAVDHAFERASVMSERRLLTIAYRQSIGHENISLGSINNSFEEDDRLLHIKEKNQTLCTTKAVLLEEKKMVDLALSGRGKMKELYKTPPELKLKDQQAVAVRHVLTTKNRVSIIRGAAGAGKTKLMGEAVAWINKAGKQVTVLAPTSQASRGVLRDEGYKDAETVAKFLVDRELQQKTADQVLWVDEAGLLGTKDMTAILEIASKNNMRVILGGDTRQHASVVRGDALRILNTVGGIKAAEVSKIYRQKDNPDYKAAVESLSKGDVKDGFEKLDKMGAITSIDILKPYEQLVEDYTKAIKKGKSALIISPTHKQNEEVTNAIRLKLRKIGLLGKKQISIDRFANTNMTQAEKKDFKNYKEGHVVQFNQNFTGIKRGSVWTVKGSEDGIVSLIDDQKNTRVLPQDKPELFDVFNRKQISISKGDKIQITRNGFDQNKKRLNNGQTLKVISVSKKGDIVVSGNDKKSKYLLKKDFNHLSHAHCITSHSSQGKTVDQVFIAQPSATFDATNAKQFYVSVSRGKESVKIYTDDKAALLENASEHGDRLSALEITTKNKRTKEYIDKHLHASFENANPNGKFSKDAVKITTQKDRDYEPEI